MAENITITALLSTISGELHAPKNQTGRFGKSRNVEGILEALKPLLIKYNAAVTLSDEIIEVGGKNYVRATATLFDSADHYIKTTAQAWEGGISRGLDAPQVTGSATSYARKYALGGLFSIDDGKDDPDQRHDAPAPAAAAKPNTTAPTKNQLAKLTGLLSDLELTDDGRADFFRDAIGKTKPTTKIEFDKCIAYAETLLLDQEDIANELKDRVPEE